MAPAVRLVADSTADLDRDYARAHDVAVVPLKVIFGEETLADGVDIDAQTFFERMTQSSVHPRTSQPTPAEFEAVFKEVAKDRSPIVCTTISSVLSGSLNSAITARQTLGNLDLRVVDSLTAGPGHRAVVEAAVAVKERGGSVDEVLTVIDEVKRTQRLIFTVETLEYLRRGGRIGGARAFLGSVLNIKPILDVRGGKVEALDKVRTLPRALDRLVDEVRTAADTWGGKARVIVAHAIRREQAEALAERVRPYCEGEPQVMLIGPVIGCHVGPGAFGIAFHRPL
ncbi:MAG TPA: DegV family protein [Candidatus Sulfotelmatobacter sp.]|jgi:DegV family protein with EDD domain|nr:DegV family protein [Candidatus Sulfotelmatobacter sp.]